MRISDWSSDVCSSDLFDHNALMALLHQKRMAFRGQVFAHQFEFGFGQCEAFDIIAPRTEGIRQHDFGGDLFQNRMADVALERIGRRSEEHTSELQSLMRISYAVFCLKKKNRNKMQS